MMRYDIYTYNVEKVKEMMKPGANPIGAFFVSALIPAALVAIVKVAIQQFLIIITRSHFTFRYECIVFLSEGNVFVNVPFYKTDTTHQSLATIIVSGVPLMVPVSFIFLMALAPSIYSVVLGAYAILWIFYGIRKYEVSEMMLAGRKLYDRVKVLSNRHNVDKSGESGSDQSESECSSGDGDGGNNPRNNSTSGSDPL